MTGILNLLLANAIPAPSTDPYFNYNTLLLPGNGTNGAQNNTFLDSSSSPFTITRNGDTTQGTFSPFSVGAGYWSNYFDGNGGTPGGYFTVADSSLFDFGSNPFTIELFVNPGRLPPNAYQFISNYLDSTTGLTFSISSSGYINVGFNGDTGAITSSSTISIGQWTHLAVSGQSGGMKLFINGVQSGSTYTGSLNIDNGAAYNIGKLASINNEFASYYNGYISNLRIVKGTALYTTTFTPPTTPLTAVSGTSLLVCQSNRFVDNSGNSVAITTYNTLSVQAFSLFNPTAAYSAATNGGSGYFDGSGDYLNTTTGIAIGSSNFTYECWVYPAASQSGNPRIFEIGGDNNDYFLLQYTASTSTLILAIGSGGGGTTICSTTITFPFAWTHIAVVREGTGSNQVKMYINGVNVSTGTSSTSIPSNYAYIGGISWASPYHWNGYISSARLVIGTAVYTSAFTPPTSPPTNITNTSLLLNFTNAGIIDNTAQNDMVTYASAQISTAQSKFGGGSILFNGTTDFIYGQLGQTWNFLTGPFTVECWIYFNSVASGYVFSNANSSGNLSNGMTLYFSSSGTLTLYGPSVSGTATTSVSTGQWYHLAVTRSGNTFYLFKDGVQQGTFTDSGSITGTDSSRYFGIGRSASYSAAGWLSAYIDEFRITKGIARYTSNFTPPSAAFPLS